MCGDQRPGRETREVNSKPANSNFGRGTLRRHARTELIVSAVANQFRVVASLKAHGGGGSEDEKIGVAGEGYFGNPPLGVPRLELDRVGSKKVRHKSR